MNRILFLLAGSLLGFLIPESILPAADRPTSWRQTAGAAADTVKKDPDTGLALDKSLNLIKANCLACHSSKLILQNRFTRDGWKEKIRWMQRTQNLWDLGESEPVVLDYLVKHYGPEQKVFDGRRKPLQNIQWYSL